MKSLAKNNQLLLAFPEFKFSNIGCQPSEKVTKDRWQQAFNFALQAHGSSMWWLGDLLVYAEPKWGEKYEQAMEESGKTYGTLRNAVYVSKAVHLSCRHDKLTFEHHYTVAKLPPDQQQHWLSLAVKNKWAVAELRRQIKKARPALPLPPGKFKIIYADPPWEYGNSGLASYGHAETHYDVMSVDELCAIPVADYAHDESILFLWTTSPQLDAAFAVIIAWGFEYKTTFVWDKMAHNHGYYNSVRHELLLVATRGSCLPEIKTLYPSVIAEQRSEHSEKPDSFRDMIVSMFPSYEKDEGAKLELFARKTVSGWTAWGDQCQAII